MAKRKSKKRSKGYLLPKYQNGTDRIKEYDNIEDYTSALKARNDSLQLYNEGLHNQFTEKQTDKKRYKPSNNFISFEDTPLLEGQDRFERNDLRLEQSEPQEIHNSLGIHTIPSHVIVDKNEAFPEEIKPIKFEINPVPNLGWDQYSAVYKKPEVTPRYIHSPNSDSQFKYIRKYSISEEGKPRGQVYHNDTWVDYYQNGGEIEKAQYSDTIYSGLSDIQKERRKSLLDAADRIVSTQGNDEALRQLLNMTAYMESTLGANPKAYGRSYTRGPMSIDNIAYQDLFSYRPGMKNYTKSQKKYFDWLKNEFGYNYKDMDRILRSDDPVAGMAAARMAYGRVPKALPGLNDKDKMWDYYLSVYNKGGIDKDNPENRARFDEGWDLLYPKKSLKLPNSDKPEYREDAPIKEIPVEEDFSILKYLREKFREITGFQNGGKVEEDYNLKRAEELGYIRDETGHLPSVDHETGMWLKSKEHPTAYKEYISMMLNPDVKAVINPEGYFEENQLQYIPRKENGGEVLAEQPMQQEVPYQEVISYPTEREPYKDPNIPKYVGKSFYKSLYNTPIPKSQKKLIEIWKQNYKTPKDIFIKNLENYYDINAFGMSNDWETDFENIEKYRKPSHPMLGEIDPETNIFIPSERNVNTNEEIAEYILQENIPVNFKKVERIPINPDGFAPGSATEFANKVIIPSNNITMKDMQEPILANGEVLMPGEEAQFDTPYVVEEKLPKAQDGIDIEGMLPEVVISAKKQYPYESCVLGMCNDLARQNTKGVREFRQLNNMYGNAWNLLDTSYGEDIDISEGYENLKEGDIIALSRSNFKSDKERGIPSSEQHMGRVTIKNGKPYVKHYIPNRGTTSKGISYGHYYEEPIENISEVFNYTPSRAKRPLAFKNIKYGRNNFKFDDNYTPNSIEKDAVSIHNDKNKLQDILKLDTDEYDELAKIAYGIMGNESSFGRSRRAVYRMSLPDAVQKIVKVLDDKRRGQDNYDSNINNLSQGYSSTKESTLHGVQSDNEEETYQEVNDRIRKGDYTGLDKTNNYLYETFKDLGLNSKNLENGANSMKAIMATLNWYKKRYPNITTDGLLKMYTGKKNLKEYKKRFKTHIRNINNNTSDNSKYTWLEDLYGGISHIANKTYSNIDDIKSFVGSMVRDSSPLPATVNAILADISGVKGDITEDSLSFLTKKELKKIVERNVKEGKMYLDYSSYFPELEEKERLAISGGMSKESKFEKAKRLLSPAGLLQNLLGQATIVNLGNGIYEIQDTYDFNDEGKTFGLIDDIKKRGIDPYSIFRSLGRNYGSSDGQGAKVRIKIKLDKSNKKEKKNTPTFVDSPKLQYGGNLKAQDGLRVDNTRTSMPIDSRLLEEAVQEAVAKEKFEKLPKEVQEKIVLQQQINDPELRDKNKGELYKGLTTKEEISNFMSDLGTEFAYAPRTLFTLEAPTIEEKLRNRSVRKDDLGEVWGNRLNSMAEGATWFLGGELLGAGLGKAAEFSIPYLLGAEKAVGNVIQPFKGTIQNYKSGINWAKNNPNWRKDYTRFQKDIHPDIRVVRRDYEKDLRNKLIEEGKVTPTIKEKIERKVASIVDDLRTKAILPLGKKEAALIGKAQQKAFDEGVDIANAWFYPTKPQGYRQNPVTGEWDIVESTETYLRPHIKNKIMGILEEGIVGPKGGSSFETGLKQAMFQNRNPYRLSSTGFNFNKSVSPAFKTKNLLLENSAFPLWEEYQKGNLTKFQALGLIKDIGKWGGMNFSGSGGPSTTFRNTGNYLKNPKSVFKVAAHETGHSLQEIGISNIHDALGHAMKFGDPRMSLSWGELVATMPRGYKYYIPNTTTKIGRKAEEILVPPHMGEQGVWHASPNEVHSELMAHRASIINELKTRGDISTEDAVKWLQENEWKTDVKIPSFTKNKKTGEWEYLKGRAYRSITPKEEYISKLRNRGFFKEGVTDDQIVEFLKLFPAFTGVAAAGSAGIKD